MQLSFSGNYSWLVVSVEVLQLLTELFVDVVADVYVRFDTICGACGDSY